MAGMTARIRFSTGSLYLFDYLFDIASCFEQAAAAGYESIEAMCDHHYGSPYSRYLQHLSG